MAEYIEREKAWRKVNRAKNIEEALNFIDSIPTADVVEVEQGEWINPTPLPDINNKEFFGTCSICEHTTMDYDEYHYCPNCGAKMDGERKCENE